MSQPNPERPDAHHTLREVFGHIVLPDARVMIEVYQGRFRGVVSSRFLRTEENELYVGYPGHGGHPVPLRRDTEIQLTANTDDGLVVLQGVIDRVVQEPEPVLVIRIPEADSVRITQQRQFVRADIALPLTYRERAEGHYAASVGAETSSLSGSGVSFISESRFDPGVHCELSLELPTHGSVRAVGRVIRCNSVRQGRRKRYEIAVTFIEITLLDQDAIVQHIFQIERSLGDPSELLLN